MNTSTTKSFLFLFAGTVVYYYLAIFDMWLFSFQPSNIALLWLPFGAGVVLIQTFGLRALPFIYIASFAANHDGMANAKEHYLFYVGILAFADTVAPYLSSVLINRYVKGSFDSISILVPFVFYGTLVPTFVSTVIITYNLLLGGYIAQEKIYEYLLWLMCSDGLGLLLLYPLYDAYKTSSIPSLKECVPIIAYTVFAIVIVWVGFHFNYLIFLLFPFLLYTAYKFKFSSVMIILLFTVIGIIALSAHYGTFFPSASQIDSMLTLITFLTSLVFVVIGTSLNNTELVINKNLANTDSLTKIKNTKAYRDKVAELLALFERYEAPFSILMLDIDNFKSINDTYGHRVGDNVLIALSSLLQKETRSVDGIFRVGGEEFIVLLPKTPLCDAVAVAEKIRINVEESLNVIADKIITISIGATEVQRDDTEDSLYRRVDELLYTSKQNGKNRVTA